MNTQKQVLVMTVLMMMTLVVLGIYAAWVPGRSERSAAEFQERTAERGALLFARNCRLCHGDVGEGGTASGRLPGAAQLNRADLQGFDTLDAELLAEVAPGDRTIEISDPEAVDVGDVILIGEERMLVTGTEENTVFVERGYGRTPVSPHFTGAAIWGFDDALLADVQTSLTNTLMCGRVGTAMPPWSLDHGGPLSDEQLRQLVVLITDARWELGEDEIVHEDELGVFVAAQVEGDPDVTELEVTDITQFEAGDALRVGLTGERMRVVEVPEFEEGASGIAGTLVVERGVLNSFAQSHGEGAEILRYPEPAEPTVLEMSCGQRAVAAAPTGPCSEEDGVFQIGSIDDTFTCSEIRTDAGGETSVALENQEVTPHNIAFYVSAEDLTPVADGSVGPVFDGPDVVDTLTFDTPDAGEYFFQCDVHPFTMRGTYIVE